MQINYGNITIKNIQDAIKTGYITEIVCNADSKTLNIKEAGNLRILEAFERLKNSIQPVINEVWKLSKSICEFIYKNLPHLPNKTISKKRFMKLLQSEGIQRNTIDKIVKSNNKQYTYARYYEVLYKLKLER